MKVTERTNAHQKETTAVLDENRHTDAEETQGTHEVNFLKLTALPCSVSEK